MRRIDHLSQAFDLANQSNIIFGISVKKGISTGQKHRTSVAAQLISAPKILFLDEPTSRLDSGASFNVMNFIRNVVKVNKFIIVTSIYEPSTTTFELLDKMLLLSDGKTHCFGDTKEAKPYVDSIGFAMPSLTNPAEFLLNLINIDLERNTDPARQRITKIQNFWNSSPRASDEKSVAADLTVDTDSILASPKTVGNSLLTTTVTLLHRSWIKSRRDILVYGIRFFTYLGLAILMGTAWLPTAATIVLILELQNVLARVA